MNVFTRKCMYGLLGAGLTVSSAGNAAPGALASKPLWMGASVKTNVILALDDSGSMAWEMIFPADQGRLTLNSSTGSFFNASGLGFNYNNSGSDEFNVVSPWLGGLEVPPIDAYGFARSPDYNGMYYNPNEIYKPWPIYGTYKPTKGPFDGQTLTKFPEANITDSSGVYRGPFNSTKEKLFETISDSFSTAEGMVYDDNGNKRTSDGGVTYNWQIGTYYLKKTTGTYLYDAGGGTASVTNTENSVLIEVESGSITGLVDVNSSCSGGSAGCSGGYVEFDGSGQSVELTFKAPGESLNIWVRYRTPSSSADRFRYNFDGEGNISHNPGTHTSWTWGKWTTKSGLTKDNNYTFSIVRRDNGTEADQFFVTTTSDVPSGIMTLSPPPPPPVVTGETRSCNPTAIAAADINGLTYYDDFRLRNGTFSVITDGSNTHTLGGIGPDGACLVKYVIPQTGTFANGATNTDAIGRTLAEEQQNFANWFMYYRRRFYAMQGGVANALDGVGNVRVGLFGINNQANVTMWDLDEASDQGSFLTKHYDDYSASGGTNLRSSLKYAGEQFKRYDSGAPIISECQKNYTLLFSDGFNTTLSYSGVGNEDGGKGAPFEDTYSGTLGDIAYKYYNTKLRTGAAFPEGAVQVSKECTDGTAPDSEDCNTNLHMNTYTVGFGLEGTIYDKDVPGVTGKKFDSRDNAHTYKDKITWPNVTTGVADERQVDDMYHAAVNGFGETYSATSPTELRTKLKNALDDIIAKSGSGSGVTFNSSSLSSTGDVGVYFTSFNAANWTGNLAARGLVKETAGTAVAGDLAPDIAWKAANILDARDITGAGLRSIYTYNGTAGVVFHWDNLTSTQKADLQAGGSVAEGQARLAYFLGNKSNDGSGTTYAFRERASRMGDVVNSTPVYVGAPASNWPETSDFGTGDDAHKKFKKDQENRTPTVWVAANDGMLHGFNAKLDPADGGGKELLAYIPNAVYNASAGDGLSYLTNPSYVHRYYNDLSPVVQDVRINTGVSTAWHSVLVGGLGAGGKGIYALDVTNPSLFTNTGPTDANAAKVVLWEFDSTDDSDLGYLVTPPSIAKMNDGSWAAVFGNGYNSTTGNTALFIVRIEEGVDGVWAAGDYTKIVLPTSASVDGLSGVSLADLDGDRIVDRIYGGDLHGNLWVFNVSSDTASNWDVAYTTGGGATKVPLYKAINADGVAQPITAAPNLAYNTETTKAGNEPNVLVGFGTGQYLSLGDNTNKEVQSFYIVWDRGSTGTTNTGLVRDDLVQRKLVFDEAAYENHGKITISSDTDDAIDWNATTDLKYGWYVDFIVGSTKYGERLITKPIFRSSKNEGIVAVFITRIPNTDSACSGGGKSSLYAMPILTGLAPTEPIVDLDGDGEIDTSSEFGVGREFGEMYDDPNMLSDNIYAACSVGENCVDTTVTNFGDVSVRTGRLGWHELINE